MAGQTGRPRFLPSLSFIQDATEGEPRLSCGPLGQRLTDLTSQHGLKAVEGAERRLVRRNGIEMFERGRWYWAEELAGREGTYVEVRWDPRELGKMPVYTDHGFLCEARNTELLGFHATLEQFEKHKRMRRVQREVVMAHLALMHMAARDISLLELATKPEEDPRFNRKRLKGQIQERAEQSPISTSLALSRAPASAKPIFTSRAQKEAWEKQQGLLEGEGSR